MKQKGLLIRRNKELYMENKKLDKKKQGLDAEKQELDIENKELDKKKQELDAEKQGLDIEKKKLNMKKQGCAMEEQKFDMEVTEYRARAMLEVLAMLYADQMGMEVNSIKIYSIDQEGKKSTNMTQNTVT